MSDDLRTRIAAALKSTYGKTQSWEDMADAVIEALGLQQEDGECGYCRAQLPGCRYVTEWTTNE